MALSAGWLVAALAVASPKQANDIEARVESVLKQLTVDEKISMIGGVEGFYVNGIPRLNLPRLKMSDGPVGVRNYGPTTAYPATLSLAAAFDPALAEKFGRSIARDARARGVHIWLAPGVNLARIPQNGRNFEYLGEDPLVAGKLAAGIIRGVQSGGVVATIKHFAGNEHENDRNMDDSQIDERTLRELYLKPFEIAIKESKPWAVMSSYNLLNGTYCSAHPWLVQQVLKKEWGFQGVYMSDWGAAHETEGTFKHGLDLEMPGPQFMNARVLKPKLESGEYPMSELDDKVRRILRLTFSMKFDQRPQEDTSIPKADPGNEAAALEVARNGIVLLKNDGILPLNATKTKKIVVVGPNAGMDVIHGGGSAFTTPTKETNLVTALTDAAAKTGATVKYMPGITESDRFFRDTAVKNPDGGLGWKAEYFGGQSLAGSPAISRVDDRINFRRIRNLGSGLGSDNFSIRWTGDFQPSTSGSHTLIARTDDGVRVSVDGKWVINSWGDRGLETDTVAVKMEAGKTYRVVVEYYQNAGEAEAHFGIQGADFSLEEQLPAAEIKAADLVVVNTGFNQRSESEGFDRPFDLPQNQQAILDRVLSLNPNAIIVNNSGGPVNLAAYAGKAKAIIQAWYPGMNGNLALVDILYGKLNPAGRLPLSWPRTLAGTYYANAYPPVNRKQPYPEKLFMGYRWFDANRVKPLYPFGYGLSYTSFHFSGLKVEKIKDGYRATVSVRNAGKMEGTETVQAYTGMTKNEVVRPVKELRAFARVTLRPGETKQVTLNIPKADLAYWSEKTKGWVVPKGAMTLWVGGSSVNLPQRATVKVD